MLFLLPFTQDVSLSISERRCATRQEHLSRAQNQMLLILSNAGISIGGFGESLT